jgi:hypothetical protein
MKNLNPKLLKRPEVEVLDDGGHSALYVRLQDKSIKAVRSIQPDPNVMIFFYLDANGFPVGIKFHESIPCVAMFRIFGKTARPYLLTEPQLVEPFLAAFEKAAEKMPEHSLGSTAQ